MRITYRLVCEDYFDAEQALTAKDRRVRKFTVIGAAILLGLGWATVANPQLAHFCRFFALLFIVSLPVGSRLNRFCFKKTYNRAVAMEPEKEFSVDISEAGLQTTGESLIEDWSHFSKYSESDRSFILYHSGSIDTIFPNRAFDQTQIDSLQNILEAKLRRA